MPLQEKSVTITENGTIEIVPDNGYALEKVKVKVKNIHKYRYFRLTPEFLDYYNLIDTDSQNIMTKLTTTVRNKKLLSIAELKNLFTISNKDYDAFCFDLSIKFVIYGTSVYSDFLLEQNLFSLNGDIVPSMTVSELLATLPEITEEEYYSFK
jgi:hypothetical protein